jgi:hypothetical protein
LTFLKNRVGSGSDPDGSDEFVGSGRVLPPLVLAVSSSSVFADHGKFYKTKRIVMHFNASPPTSSYICLDLFGAFIHYSRNQIQCSPYSVAWQLIID